MRAVRWISVERHALGDGLPYILKGGAIRGQQLLDALKDQSIGAAGVGAEDDALLRVGVVAVPDDPLARL
jgi:hypothetical protein